MVQFVTLLPLSDYIGTIKLMEKQVTKLINKSVPETVYLVEYKDVYTAGTSFKEDELLSPNNVPVIYTSRGGRFTYHGPGQRVVYPILDLSIGQRKKDLKLYIKMLEEWIINSLFNLGIKAFVVDGRVGIWVEENGNEAKIAAIGVRVKKWITYHGLAINISTNLNMFSGIIACGLCNFPATSLVKLGINIEMIEFDKIIEAEFGKIFC